MTHPSSRRTDKSNPRQTQKELPPPAKPRQMRIAFESSRLGGLPAAERAKILMDLAGMLLLAAGVAVEESANEC